MSNLDKAKPSKTKKKIKPKKVTKIRRSSKKRSKPKSREQLSRFQRWKIRAHEKVEERLAEESKKMVLLKFFAAPIIACIGIAILFLILNYDTFLQVGGLMLAYFFPPAGKESVIPIGIGLNLHPILIGLSVAFVDIFIAIFLLWNYDFAKLLPILGSWMERSEKRGSTKFKDHPWMEKLAFIALILFVMFPFQGSGAIGTTIIGRVIGMDKYKVLVAIIIGAIVGCLLIAYFSDFFKMLFEKNIYFTLGLLIVIAIILGIYDWFKLRKKEDK